MKYLILILALAFACSQTTDQLRRGSEGQYGLAYDEALEMAYENIQSEAHVASKGLKPISFA